GGDLPRVHGYPALRPGRDGGLPGDPGHRLRLPLVARRPGVGLMAEARQDGAAVAERLQARFPDAVVEAGSFRGQHWVELRAERLLEVCAWLRDDPETDYAM